MVDWTKWRGKPGELPISSPTRHCVVCQGAHRGDPNLAVDLYLGQNVSLSEQLSYRYIIDADGYARTWSAWAWKMMSGSTVLSLESPWTAFFTEQFSPWEHFVPIANDCSDLAEKLYWCRDNDTECQAIAKRACEHAKTVYDIASVTKQMTIRFRERLAELAPQYEECNPLAVANHSRLKLVIN